MKIAPRFRYEPPREIVQTFLFSKIYYVSVFQVIYSRCDLKLEDN